MNGPNVAGKNDGYEPLSLVAPKEGVYIFRFYSTGLSTDNPVTTSVDNLASGNKINNQQKRGTVACWDVTVVNGNEIKTGRTWTYTLCLNMGSNRNAGGTLNSKVYVLTDDGYTYETDFNGMDPFGFIFFANSRGLIDLTTDTSLYKSVKDPKNDNAISNLGDLNIGFHNPRSLDTQIDKTHKIFFNTPSDDLPSKLKEAIKTPTITNVCFKSLDTNHTDNTGNVGAGGYFYIEGENLTSFSIHLNFKTRKSDDGSELNSDLISNRTINASYQENSGISGCTKVYWDGLDGDGKVVPYGNYGDDSNKFISIEAKSGEFHFPMLDIENNVNGVKIKCLNDSDDTTNSKVYYNNSGVDTLKNLSDADTSKDGIDSHNKTSKDGTLMFSGKNGDMVAIDLWTYKKSALFTPENDNKLSLHDAVTLNVKKEWKDNNNHDGIRPDNISVQVFKNGQPIKDAAYTVQLDKSNQWQYSWTLNPTDDKNVDLNEYTVKEIKIGDEEVINDTSTNYQISYQSKESTIENTDGSTFINNKSIVIANTHEDKTTSMQVEKIWEDDDNADGLRPESVNVVLMADNAPVVDSQSEDDAYVIKELNESNGWKASVDNLPVYKEGKLINYEFVESDTYEGYEGKSVNDHYKTIITNTHVSEKTSAYIEKIWEDDNDEKKVRPESIHVVLYKNDKKTDIVVELNADNDWQATLTDLIKNVNGNPADYRFVEESVPEFYDKKEESKNNKTKITNTLDKSKLIKEENKQEDNKPDNNKQEVGTNDNTNTGIYYLCMMLSLVSILLIRKVTKKNL